MTSSSPRPAILLIEDDVDDQELTVRAFEGCNIMNPIVIARDGAAALELLHGKNAIPAPALVLLDLSIPRVPGMDVLASIRSDERTRNLPVVILTSSTQELDLIKGYRFGANSFIRKPIDFPKFVDVVRQLGLYWLVVNVPPSTALGT